MTWDPVPWFVGGGAQHSPEVARLLAYASTSGAEGIVAPGDLKVVSLDVPGASIRVLPGAALILNRSPGGAQQTYVGRNPTADTQGVSSTGSGSGRSDLVVARIRDPFVPGAAFAVPANPAVGPYVDTYIVPNVAPGTTSVPAGVSGIALARIDIPRSTGTITQAMITDLRSLALPRSSDDLASSALPTTGGAIDTLDWKTWPEGLAKSILIPTWATHISVVTHYSGVVRDGGSVGAELRGRIGDIHTAGAVIIEYDAGTRGYDEAAREGFFHVAGSFIPENRRGTRIELATEARRVSPTIYSGVLRSADSAQVAWDVRFYERAT